MATVEKWTPFGVALNITATGGTVKRISATKYTVVINVSWKTYWDGAQTNYGMTASSGGGSATINKFGTKSSGGSGSFTGTYSISGNASASKTITVTFKNFNTDNGDSATKTVSFTVSVPAWTSYKVSFNANGGSGAPSAQTKWKDQTLTLSSTKPTRSGYTFMGWGTSASDTSADYSAGGSYTANSAITLYAVWRKQLTVTYNANGGSGAPSSQSAYVYNSTTSKAFTLSSTKPTRTGYTFLGWSTSSSATSATYSAGGSITISSNTTLYAVWKINSYSLTVNPVGGTWNGKTGKSTITQNYNTTKNIPDPTWTGHTFSKWDLFGSGILDGKTYTFGAGAGELQASWDLNGYDVVFDGVTNGGYTWVLTNAQYQIYSSYDRYIHRFNYGESLSEGMEQIPTAVRDNYKFVGWFTKPVGGTQITEDYVVTKNVTFYAQFEIDASAYTNDNGEWKAGITYINEDGKMVRGNAKVNDNGTWKDGYCN